jgi:hypothetical protein
MTEKIPPSQLRAINAGQKLARALSDMARGACRPDDYADLAALDALAEKLETSPLRIARIIAIAEVIGRDWREQEGINGKLLDDLAQTTK